MKRNSIIVLALIIVLILAVMAARRPTDPVDGMPSGDRVVTIDEDQPEDEAGTPTQTVSGVILEKDDGCFADGICRINVGGTWVVTNQGWYRGPLGTVANDLAVGMTVEAYGKVTDEGLTMLGSDSYYVRVQ